MAKRKTPNDRGAIDPEDVLAGRARVTAVELLDLIHRVNPTGRDLSAREAAARYAQKSRLQSLLVRRFADSLEVVPDPDREGTVSLIQRGHGRDGCHAVIAALDEDARSWVQMQIDLGPPSGAPPAATAARPSGRGTRSPPPLDADEEPLTPSALLRRAAEAVEAYDYEQARRDLERALAIGGGAREPAEALLGLLVETLGADVEALAIEASLSRGALDAAGVRGLLALAAARTGDERRALSLSRGAEDGRAAAAFVALAAGALAAGDATRAGAHLERARKLDASHPALSGLEGEIAGARAAERGPIEAELAELCAAGRDVEAEKKAGEVLARWPESEAARRALRGVEDRRRRAEAERLAAEAEGALAAGDRADARARLTRALAAARGPEREAIEQRLRALDVMERAAREAAEVERVERLLQVPEPGAGLRAYLELDDALRVRARERVAIDAVRWLELTARGSPHARVEAVLALMRARGRLATGDGEAALALLAPHMGLLDRVPEARQLAREAEAMVSLRRTARAREAVAAARDALAKGAAAEARALLDEATIRDLPEPEQGPAAALRAEASAVALRRERIERLGQLRAQGKLFEARALAEDLAAEAEGAERARWEEEQRAIQAAIQRALRVEVDEEPAPIDDTSGLMVLVSHWDAARWLLPDGRSLVMAESTGRWVRVHVFDVVDRTVRARLVLRAPEPTGHVHAEVTGDTLWLLAARGGLLGLSLSTWEVQVQRRSADVLPAGTVVTSFALPVGRTAAAPRFLWAEPHAAEAAHCARVVDLEQHRPWREVPEATRISSLAGAREPRVACFRDQALILHEDRGTAVIDSRVEVPDAMPVGVAFHPDGRSLVVLALIRPVPTDPQGFAWFVVPEGGPPGPLHPIEDADGESPARIAAAGDAGIVAIELANRSAGKELLVLGASSGALAPLYRVPLSAYALLAQDARGRKLVVVESLFRRLAVAELGTTPPELPRWHLAPRPWIDNVIDVAGCLDYAAKDKPGLDDLAERLGKLSLANVAALIRDYQRRRSPAVDEGFTLVHVLGKGGASSKREAQRLLTWMWERFPHDPEARLQHAARLGREGKWAEIENLFDPALDNHNPRAAHFHHMLALAALHAGDLDRARARLAELRALFSPALCTIEPLEQLLAPPPDPLAPATESPSLAQLAEDARTADRCLERGDAHGALAALSHEQYEAFGDVQLFARMAEAHLGIEPCRPRERFDKIMALARFVEAHEEKDPERRRELPIPGATWAPDQLDRVAERSSAWLDALRGGEG